MSRWLALVICGCGVTATPPRPQPVSATPVVPADTQPPQTWRPVTTAPFSAAGLPILLTDGTVMVQELETENWWQLTPDVMGNYATGTWSKLASMPTGYSPLYTATAVLPDGRVIVEGGEYIAGNFAFSTDGALYDPLANAWTAVSPPPGWQTIGDASGMVLPNGQFLLSSCCDGGGPTALLQQASLTWADTGGGKLDINDEESWALLWDDTIITVDANNANNLKSTEIYDPATGQWHYAGDTPVQIDDTDPADMNSSHEVGPNIVRMDGTVLAIGGNGHNAIYDPTTKTWASAPDFPVVAEGQLDTADGPAAVLPNGNVLVATSPGIFNTPTHFFEWDGTAFTEVAATPNAPQNTTYQQMMLVLPTGDILMTDFSNDVELYAPAPGIVDGAVPVITSAPALVTLARGTAEPPRPLDEVSDGITPVADLFLGHTYKMSALRMNGLNQGAYYGDDDQSYTNYPLVRLTFHDTMHVVYCRTHDHSTRAIGPDKHGTTQFDVPATAERGLADLEVVTNGIASPPILVNVK
jgi:hypothetical protein